MSLQNVGLREDSGLVRILVQPFTDDDMRERFGEEKRRIGSTLRGDWCVDSP
jgi:hypothetical protein